MSEAAKLPGMRRPILPAAALTMAVVVIGAMVAPLASAEPPQYPGGTGLEGAESFCKAYSSAFEERWSRQTGVFYKNLTTTRVRKMFEWAGQHLRRTYRQLAALSWPAEDKASIARWLERIKMQPEFLEVFGALFGREHTERSVELILERRFVRNGEIANSIVAGLDFKYCRFKDGLLE